MTPEEHYRAAEKLIAELAEAVADDIDGRRVAHLHLRAAEVGNQMPHLAYPQRYATSVPGLAAEITDTAETTVNAWPDWKAAGFAGHLVTVDTKDGTRHFMRETKPPTQEADGSVTMHLEPDGTPVAFLKDPPPVPAASMRSVTDHRAEDEETFVPVQPTPQFMDDAKPAQLPHTLTITRGSDSSMRADCSCDWSHVMRNSVSGKDMSAGNAAQLGRLWADHVADAEDQSGRWKS